MEPISNNNYQDPRKIPPPPSAPSQIPYPLYYKLTNDQLNQNTSSVNNEEPIFYQDYYTTDVNCTTTPTPSSSSNNNNNNFDEYNNINNNSYVPEPNNSETFHYQNSNYMNWTIPFYTQPNDYRSYVSFNQTPISSYIQPHLEQKQLITIHQQQLQQEQQQYYLNLQQQQQQELLKENENEKSEEEGIQQSFEFAMSLLIFLLGFFLVIPWYFGILYIHSKNKIAKNLSITSLIFGIAALLGFVTYILVYGAPFL
eukprot:gene6103-7606_t